MARAERRADGATADGPARRRPCAVDVCYRGISRLEKMEREVSTVPHNGVLRGRCKQDGHQNVTRSSAIEIENGKVAVQVPVEAASVPVSVLQVMD